MPNSFPWTTIARIFGLLITLNLAAGPFDFFIAPETESMIPLFGINTEHMPEYQILNYDGNRTGSGKAEMIDGKPVARVCLPAGFHELEFRETDRRIGVVALPEYRGEIDDYWGVNTIFTVKAISGGQEEAFSKRELQESYLNVLVRSGIGHIREMAAFYRRIPEEGKVDFELGRWAELRDLARNHGIRVLTFYEHFPDWLGAQRPEQIQATRLDRFAEPFLAMLRREGSAADGVQIYNEGDTPGKCAPPDGALALTWTVRNLLNREKSGISLIGMAFAYQRPPESLLKIYAANGFFDAIDAMAFHYYDNPDKMACDLEHNINFIGSISDRIPPLWITESGRAWPQGPRRPSIEADQCSGNWIVRKAVEAKACGASRYYVFCLPYFDERKNNFGMFDRDSTPLRSFAAYVAAVGILSGKNYVGNLACPPEKVGPVRVFSDGQTAVAVVASEVPLLLSKPLSSVVTAAIGIDGSAVVVRPDGAVKVRGGVLYLEMTHNAVEKLLDRNSAAMRTARLLRLRNRPPRETPPVILRHHFEECRRNASGYQLETAEFPLKVTAFNFSDTAVELRLKLEIDDRKSNSEFTIIVPAGGSTDFSRNVKFGKGESHTLRLTERNGNSSPLFLQFASKAKAFEP